MQLRKCHPKRLTPAGRRAMAEGDLADQLVTYALKRRTTLWRIFWNVYGPLESHPHPTGRMARVQDVPPGNVGFGGIYLATTTGGACWEVVLRDATAREGKIYVARSELVGRSLVKLRALAPVPLVDLRLPGRRALFDGRDASSWTRVNTFWRLILDSPDHTQSHHAAAELATLATQLRLTFAGCTWLSAQHQGSSVHLLYDPPFERAGWEVVGDCIPLSSAAGIAALRAAARDAHLTLVLTGGVPFPCEDDGVEPL